MSFSKQSESVYKYVCAGVCRSLSSKYGFPYEEAMSYLEALPVEVEKAKREKREKKEKIVKPSLSLPFCGVIEGLCSAIAQDGGLYTQCKNEAKEGKYCVRCSKGRKYGDVEERVARGAEWRTPDGKEPTLYGKVMLKKGITKEDAVAEAEKFGWVIPEEQFEVNKPKPVKEKKAAAAKRGRPEKKKDVETTAGGDDLIAQLVAQAQQMTVEEEEDGEVEPEVENEVKATVEEDDADDESVEDLDGIQEVEVQKVEVQKVEVQEEPKKPAKKAAAKKPKMTKEEREAAKEAEKLAKQQAKEAEKLAKQQAKEAEKLAKQQEKEAEKLAKQQAKEAAAAEKKEKAKAAAAEKKEKAKAAAAEKKAEPVKPVEAPVVEEAELQADELDEEAVEVVKFEHEGIIYLRDENNVLYDMESQDEVGTWDEAAGKIVPLADDEEEE